MYYLNFTSFLSLHFSFLTYFSGANRTQRAADALILSPSQCKLQAPILTHKKNKTQVNVVSLQWPGCDDERIYTNFDCPYPQQDMKKPQATTKTRTRGTQSLYRWVHYSWSKSERQSEQDKNTITHLQKRYRIQNPLATTIRVQYKPKIKLR